MNDSPNPIYILISSIAAFAIFFTLYTLQKRKSKQTQELLIPSDLPPSKKEPLRHGKGHPRVFEGPKNRIEEALIAMRIRKIETTCFLVEFFNSQIYVLPLAKDLVRSPEKMTLSESPILFCMNYPEYSAIAVYTSPERAKPTCDLHPDFRYATEVNARDFLSSLKGDFGLVINPYWDINVEWNSQQVTAILAMLKKNENGG